MKTDENEIILLYERLLDAAVHEKNEIAQRNLDRIEHYCSLKENLIKELEELNNNGKTLISSHRERAEIESLIKKIIDLNKSNAGAVGDMKDEVISDISTLRRSKTAFKAYRSCA